MTTAVIWGRTVEVLQRVEVPAAELTEAEVRRLEAFHDPGDRNDYLAAHLLVRHVARKYGVMPVPLTLEHECPACGRAHGKPRLAEAPHLTVSLSHTAGAVIAGLSTGLVGVDLEPYDAADAAAIAPVLDAAETSYLVTAPAHEAVRLWCRKEAASKAVGRGLEAMADVSTVEGAAPKDGWQGLAWTEQLSHGYFVCVASTTPVRIRSIEDI